MAKIKIIVFRSGGPLKHFEKWYFKGSEIEIVSHNKYILNCLIPQLFLVYRLPPTWHQGIEDISKLELIVQLVLMFLIFLHLSRCCTVLLVLRPAVPCVGVDSDLGSLIV